MSRTPIIAGNWKMHLDHLEAIQLVQNLTYHLETEDYDASELVVCPSFTSLRSISTLIEGDKLDLQLGAQDCHPEESGAHTGEVSAGMLEKLKVRYVIVGHSERRQAGETNELVARKLTAVRGAGMRAILCVGETLSEREGGRAEEVVAAQLRGSLAGFDAAQADALVVAYEPVWAIGTGKTATSGDADQMCGTVRTVVGDVLGSEVAEALRVQYGGSVKPGNVADLLRRPHIDGALVGGASLDAEDFAVICRWHRL